MRYPLAFLAALALACGSPRSEPRPSMPIPAPSEAERETPIVDIHEWGLIDVDLTTGVAEIAAGPGQPARPVIARKPVLYLHLLEGDTQSLTVRARVPGGSILEHWPPGELAGDTVAWQVGVRRGVCRAAAARESVRGRRAACATPDGFCEIPELPRYVTADHDCLDVGGAEASLLFYRASVRADALPLRVERGPDMRVTITAESDVWEGPREILRLSTALSGPWPLGRVVVARASIPRRGETTIIPVGGAELDPAAERAAMTQALGELGLTPSEARVFLEAWGEALFGASSAARRGPSPAQDVLLYWLSPAHVARLAVIDASPAMISLRRAFLVRITLPAVPTA